MVRNCDGLISYYTGTFVSNLFFSSSIIEKRKDELDGHAVRRLFAHGHPVDGGTSRGSVKNPHATVTANTG